MVLFDGFECEKREKIDFYGKRQKKQELYGVLMVLGWFLMEKKRKMDIYWFMSG